MDTLTCTASETCENRRKYANGWCATHYRRNQQYGSPFGQSVASETLPVEPLARFVQRVERPIDYDAVSNVLQAANGVVSVAKADEIACTVLGVHPSAIWGPEWFEVQQAA